MPGDAVHLYKTEPHPRFLGQLMLAHKPNGDCIYLGDRGCTIYSSRPEQCRSMDCRNLLALKDHSMIRPDVIARAKELIASDKGVECATTG